MLHLSDLHPYQLRAVNHQIAHPWNFLWLFLGSGKTAVTETTISHLINHRAIRAALIVAPLRVIQSVWAQEAQKWSHLKHLKFSLIHGNKQERLWGLFQPADVYLINYENLAWLSAQLQHYFINQGTLLPFDMLVLDESSKMKNHETVRMEAIAPLMPYFIYRTGLTGTPASNGLEDLFGQFLVIDGGQRLGTSYTDYISAYFAQDGDNGYKYKATEAGKKWIHQNVSDIVLEMSQEDYLQLPDLIINDIYVDLSPKHRRGYEELERELFTELDNGVELEVMNEVSKVNKCLQYSNGAAYVDTKTREWHPIHDAKLDALEDIVEESGGEPILVAYNYRPDAYRILKRFPFARNITGMSGKEFNEALAQWQRGEIRMLIGHPACLHPDTEVLTESRGWIRIVEVFNGERVHDGVEFVHHAGCSYSGYREVIDVFGVKMTPGHKILINDKWVEARHVGTDKKTRESACFTEWETSGVCPGPVSRLRYRNGDDATKLHATHSRKSTLLGLFSIAQKSEQADVRDMEWVVKQGARIQRFQELRRSWDIGLRKMGQVREFLYRYAQGIRRLFNDRTHRQFTGLLQGELSLGYQHGTTIEQEEQSNRRVSGQENSSCRVSSSQQFQQNDATDATQQGDDGRRSGQGLSPVYDLINCGPRNRFLIRNPRGEVFVSHNSMGHGIDGLQKRGRIMVWFGLNWSLELTMQFNARLHRQGQGHPVVCHRILTENTFDDVVHSSLEWKNDTQEGLRKAVSEYRKRKEGRITA